jgi:hypothetical protein
LRALINKQYNQVSRVVAVLSFDPNMPRAPHTWRRIWDSKGKIWDPKTNSRFRWKLDCIQQKHWQHTAHDAHAQEEQEERGGGGGGGGGDAEQGEAPGPSALTRPVHFLSRGDLAKDTPLLFQLLEA